VASESENSQITAEEIAGPGAVALAYDKPNDLKLERGFVRYDMSVDHQTSELVNLHGFMEINGFFTFTNADRDITCSEPV
jgi:hypothetical protein